MGLRLPGFLIQRCMAGGKVCLDDQVQRVNNLPVRLLEETRRKLVQQTPDVFGCAREDLRMLFFAAGVQLDMLQSLFERAGNLRQCRKTNRGRAPAQRMGQRNSGVRNGPVQLQRPLAQFAQQAARPFVRLIEVHVVQRNANAQRTDDFDRLVARLRSLFCSFFCSFFRAFLGFCEVRTLRNHGLKPFLQKRLRGCLGGLRACILLAHVFIVQVHQRRRENAVARDFARNVVSDHEPRWLKMGFFRQV